MRSPISCRTAGEAPGIVANRSDQRVTYTSRGFDLSRMVDGVPTLAYYSVAAEDSMNSTVIYDRIEVIRGPAGLLNGVGYPGGAINLVRKRPTREFKGQLSFGLGSWDRYSGQLDLGGPINASGTIRARLVASRVGGDDFVERKSRTEDVLYGIVEADLGENTTLAGGFEYQKTAIDGSNFGNVPYFYADGSRTNLPRSFSSGAPWTFWDMETKRAFANLEHRFDNGWRLKLDAVYARNERQQARADIWLYPITIDPTTGDGVISAATNPAYGTNKTIDLYATGPFELFGQEHKASIGFNFNDYHYYQTGNIAGGNGRSPGNIFELASWSKPDFSIRNAMLGAKIKETALYGSTQLKLETSKNG